MAASLILPPPLWQPEPFNIGGPTRRQRAIERAIKRAERKARIRKLREFYGNFTDPIWWEWVRGVGTSYFIGGMRIGFFKQEEEATGTGGSVPVVESVTGTTDTENSGCTWNMPTTRPDGDLYFLHLARDDDGAYGTGDDWGDWTAIRDADNPDSNTARFYTGYRVGSSEPATYKFGHSVGNEYFYAHVLRISGADTGDVLDADGFSSADSGTTATAPSITCNEDNTLVLRIFQCDTDAFTNSSAGTGITEEYREGGGSSGQQGTAGYSEDGPGSGNTTGTLNQTGFNDNWFANTISLNSANP